MPKKMLNLLLVGIAIALLAPPAWAAKDTPAKNVPAVKKAADTKAVPAADTQALKAEVVAVKGIAHRRDGADPKSSWRKLKVGDKLDEQTLIRTGLGASVVIRFADRGRVKIGSATKIGISEFQKQGRLARTRLGLKYGSIRAKVDRSAGPNDFRIRTPVATLSVRGSKGGVGFSGDRGLSFHSTQSTWTVSTTRGRMRVKAGESADGNRTLSGELNAKKYDTQTGDPFGGLSGNEKRNLRNNGGGRGIFGFTGGGNGPLLIIPLDPTPPPPGRVPIPIPPSPGLSCGT